MEFQTFLTLHSVYHSFRHCQLTFFKFSSMKYFRRSLFNYFTTLPKNVNHKNKKPSLFSVTVDIVLKLPEFESIQYHRQHIHNL